MRTAALAGAPGAVGLRPAALHACPRSPADFAAGGPPGGAPLCAAPEERERGGASGTGCAGGWGLGLVAAGSLSPHRLRPIPQTLKASFSLLRLRDLCIDPETG